MGPFPIPVLDQCEHFYSVLYFPFGPCTSHGSVSVECEYTITNIIAFGD